MAYDADGAREVQCVILITTDADADEGQIAFDLMPGEADGRSWLFFMEDFRPYAEGMEDAIREDFRAFGATGLGGSLLPEAHVESAGWGEMAITVDQKRLPDAVTGEPTWRAFYAVLTTGVRDDATGRMLEASAPGDKEIHVVITSHAPPPQEPMPVEVPATSAAGDYARTHPLHDNKYWGAVANWTLTVGGGGVQTTDLTFRFRDPEGAVVRTFDVSGSASGQARTYDVGFVMDKLGMHTLEVEGNGVGVEYSVEGSVVPPEQIIHPYWWEEVVYDDEALLLYETLRHDH
jgi:hypothetical protein